MPKVSQLINVWPSATSNRSAHRPRPQQPHRFSGLFSGKANHIHEGLLGLSVSNNGQPGRCRYPGPPGGRQAHLKGCEESLVNAWASKVAGGTGAPAGPPAAGAGWSKGIQISFPMKPAFGPFRGPTMNRLEALPPRPGFAADGPGPVARISTGVIQHKGGLDQVLLPRLVECFVEQTTDAVDGRAAPPGPRRPSRRAARSALPRSC